MKGPTGTEEGRIQSEILVNESRETMPDTRYHCEMTVAHLRESEEADHVQVMFLESARIYTLRRDNPAFDQILRSLRDAQERQCLVNVGFASLESDTIEVVSDL